MKRLKISLDDQSIYVRISDRAAEDLEVILKIAPPESDLELLLALLRRLVISKHSDRAQSQRPPDQILPLDR